MSLHRLRLKELEGVRAEVAQLITLLGAAQVQDRERAVARLIPLGEAAIPGLKVAVTGGDREIQARIATLLKKFDDSGVSKRPVGDVLRLGDMVVQGWLDGDALLLATRRGGSPARRRWRLRWDR